MVVVVVVVDVWVTVVVGVVVVEVSVTVVVVVVVASLPPHPWWLPIPHHRWLTSVLVVAAAPGLPIPQHRWLASGDSGLALGLRQMFLPPVSRLAHRPHALAG